VITFWVNSGKPHDAAMLISLSSVVCDVLYSGETDGPICVKFQGRCGVTMGQPVYILGQFE